MPRYRNLNNNQQARVQAQMQSGNFGQGAAGRVAQRRFDNQQGRINTTPALVTDQAPQTQQVMKPTVPVGAPQRPMMPPPSYNPRQEFHQQQQQEWASQGGPAQQSMGEMPRPMGGMWQQRESFMPKRPPMAAPQAPMGGGFNPQMKQAEQAAFGQMQAAPGGMAEAQRQAQSAALNQFGGGYQPSQKIGFQQPQMQPSYPQPQKMMQPQLANQMAEDPNQGY